MTWPLDGDSLSERSLDRVCSFPFIISLKLLIWWIQTDLMCSGVLVPFRFKSLRLLSKKVPPASNFTLSMLVYSEVASERDFGA